MSNVDRVFDPDTLALHAVECPGCGYEPEVVTYWVRTGTQRRVGYTCHCGARVIAGVVQGFNIG